MVSQPDDADRSRRYDQRSGTRTYRCTEPPPALQRWDASSLLTQHAGHDPAQCLPYAAALARLSTPLS
ncbi:hypothetical protein [Nocardia asteroides]|uniref:hypothetical protein n=1 Tax=Nocardia asteroides TaxID=1824 RepID=UPI001E2F3F4C|nr:hypothetical protein [Nocardia asteroides]UGT60238.1 hypothetical protein LTT61_23985 [Nocardia asteroides]